MDWNLGLQEPLKLNSETTLPRKYNFQTVNEAFFSDCMVLTFVSFPVSLESSSPNVLCNGGSW